MAAPTTFELYAALATERPAKARRYRLSILDTLERTTIHPIERERLTEALAGIASVLGEVHTCRRCGRTVESDEAKTSGLGSHCRTLEVAS